VPAEVGQPLPLFLLHVVGIGLVAGGNRGEPFLRAWFSEVDIGGRVADFVVILDRVARFTRGTLAIGIQTSLLL